MSKRNDLHNAVNLVTENYEYVYAADLQSPWALGLASTVEGQKFLHELHNYDPATADRGCSQCHHCGARLRYVAWLRHTPTGYMIVVGETCLENRFERATGDFQRLRKAAELDRAKMRIKNAVLKFTGDNPDLAFMADSTGETTPEASQNNSFIADVARKLRLYGELSERQVDAVRNALVRDQQNADRKAAELANPELLVPVVEGKQQITGEVLSVKWHEDGFGGRLVMTVKDERGFKVWGTVPASLPNVERGDKVIFSATVTKSDRDETFGFFKRPTKGIFLNEKVEEDGGEAYGCPVGIEHPDEVTV